MFKQNDINPPTIYQNFIGTLADFPSFEKFKQRLYVELLSNANGQKLEGLKHKLG